MAAPIVTLPAEAAACHAGAASVASVWRRRVLVLEVQEVVGPAAFYLVA